MITREKHQEILRLLQEQFAVQTELYHKHIERIDTAIKWWNENVKEHKDSLVGSTVVVNGVDCMCTHVYLRGTPLYQCVFKFAPINYIDDAGAGFGRTFVKEF